MLLRSDLRTPREERTGRRDELRPSSPHEMTESPAGDGGDDATSATSTDTIEKPHVGGVYGGTAWTGGSNMDEAKRTRPKTIFARRPSDFHGASKIEETTSCGLPEDRRLGIEKSPVSLTTWIRLIHVLMEDTGQDTVFCPTEDGLKINLLEDWGQPDPKRVKEWVATLESGVG